MLSLLRALLLTATLSAFIYNAGVSAGSKATDADIKAVRELFEETAHGVPSERFRGNANSLKQVIDLDFAKRLYQIPHAMDAIQEVFTGANYQDINQRLGQIRNEVNLRIWAEIAKEYDIPIELNDAGKKNGALSDLDKFFAANGNRLAGVSSQPRDIQAFLIEEHGKRWRQQMGVDPVSYDVMHFSSSGLMRDWRMSNSHWSEFGVELDRSIAELAGTEGAYFVPGGYKTQVYTRYHLEGKTTRIEPHANPESEPTHIKDVDGLAEGVLVTEDLPTSENSKLYGTIPFDIDRTGALGSVLQNYMSAVDTANAIKNAKYNNRWMDTGLVHLTNLEVDFRRLILEGNNSIIDYHIEKLFMPLAEESGVLGRIGDQAEVKRVIEVLARLELDKVIRGLGNERPKHWTPEWQNYQPKDINEARVKMEYFDQEIEAIRPAFSNEEWNSMSDEDKAGLGEREFRRKAHELGRVGATIAAKRVFNDVFTYDGFAKLRRIHGTEAAKRLVTERVKELHASFIFIEDANLINQVLAEAPPEARRSLTAIADIADAQRAEVLEMKSRVERISDDLENVKRATNQVFVDDLAQKLNDNNQILRDLINTLDMPEMARISPADIARGSNIPGAYRLRLGDLSLEYARQEISATYREAVERMISEGQIAISQNSQEAFAATKRFFDQDLPDTVRPTKLISGTWDNFKDIGTVDAAGKVFAAYLKGDYKKMEEEARDTVLGNVPIGGTAYGFAKAIKDYEQGKSTPLVMFVGQQLLARTAEGAKYGGLIGVLNTIYGMEQTLMDIGWTVVGQPTQDAAISYILMGDLSAVESGGGGGALPLFKEETIELLAQNALLRNRVSDGDLNFEARKKILRSHFLSQANRKATALGRSEPGPFTAWEEDRERSLQRDYFLKHEYWLRRLNFYQQTHIGFFSWVESRTLDDNWQRIDNNPPSFLEGYPQSQLEQDWGFAYTKRPNGSGYWDHERIWLHRYFDNWVSEWEKTQPEFGEFMYYLNNRAFTGDWRQKTIEKLIGMFQEGELYDYNISKAKAQSNPSWGNAFNDLVEGVSNNLERVGAKILEDEGLERLNRFMAMEQLYWHPEIEKRIREGFEQALDREPEYEAIEPELSVNFPRAVARMGSKLDGDFTIIGDPELIPEDVQLEIEFRPVRTWEQDRPQEVLDDHILTLFGVELDDDEIQVAEHEATFRATSASDSAFRAETKETIYWVGYFDEDDEDEEGEDDETGEEDEGEDGDPPLTQGEIDSLTGLVAGELGWIAASCEQAKREATAARDGFNTIANALQQLMEGCQSTRDKISDFQGEYIQLATLLQFAQNAADQVAQNRDEMARLKDRVCNLAMQYSKASNPEVRNDLMAEMLDLLDDAKNQRGTALGLITQLYGHISSIESSYNEYHALLKEIEELTQQYYRLANQYQENIERLANAVELQSTANEGIAQLEQLRDRALGMLARASEMGNTEMINAVEAQIVRIDQAIEDARQCPIDLSQLIGEAQLQQTQAAEVMQEANEAVQALPQNLNANVDVGVIESVNDDAQGLKSITELFWESIENRLNDITACIEWAREQEAPKVGVPNLSGMSAGSAMQALENRGLKAKPLGGDPALRLEDQFKVQDQDPPAGSSVFAGSDVTFRIYGEVQVVKNAVPNVRNLHVTDAMASIRNAGFEPNIVGGDPATTAAQSHTVQDQNPSSGALEEAGTRITLWVRGKYEAPRVEPRPQPQPRPQPRPEPQPQPVQPQPTPPVQPQPVASKYVVFDVWQPDVMANKPDDVKFSDWLQRINVSNVRYKKADDQYMAFEITGDALGRYDYQRITAGNRYSMLIDLRIDSLAQNPGESSPNYPVRLNGAFLFTCAYVFDSFAALREVYPDIGVVSQQMFDLKSLIKIQATTGKFSTNFRDEEGNAGNFYGGPIEEGWSQGARSANLEMMKQFAEIFDCFIATAAYRGAIQAEPVQRLRAFRDKILKGSDEGRRFIELYYKHAPALAIKIWENPKLAKWVGRGVSSLAWLAERFDSENHVHQWALEKCLLSVNLLLEKRSNEDAEQDLLEYPHRILLTPENRNYEN